MTGLISNPLLYLAAAASLILADHQFMRASGVAVSGVPVVHAQPAAAQTVNRAGKGDRLPLPTVTPNSIAPAMPSTPINPIIVARKPAGLG